MRFVLCMYTDQEERNFRNSIRPAEGFFLAVCVCARVYVCVHTIFETLCSVVASPIHMYVYIRTDRTANISNIFGVLEEKNTSLRISEDRFARSQRIFGITCRGARGLGVDRFIMCNMRVYDE